MPISTSAQAAALWTALTLLVLLVLSLQVVRQRTKHKVLIGDDGVPELVRAVRAFGNATEYAGPGMAALIMLAVVGASPLAIHHTNMRPVISPVSTSNRPYFTQILFSIFWK